MLSINKFISVNCGKILLISFIFLFSFTTFSSGNDTTSFEIDSLTLLVEQSEDNDKIDNLISLARAYFTISPRKSLHHAFEAFDFAEQIDYNQGMASALNRIGTGYILLNSFDSALIYLNRSLELSMEIEYKKGMAMAYGNIGLIFDYLGEYNQAIENHLNSLKVEEELENQKGIAASLNNIGNIYYQLDDFDLALEYFQRSLRINQELGDDVGVAQLFNNIGAIYHKKRKLDKALLYFQSSLVINKELDNPADVASCYNNLGNIYFEMEEDDNALENYTRSYEISSASNDLWSMANTTRNLGGLYLKLGNFTKSQEYLEQTLEIASQLKSRDLMAQTYQSLSELYASKGDYRSAFDLHMKYSELSDSIYNTETNVRIAELEMGYQVQKEIQKQEKENEIQQLKIERSTRTIYFIIAFLVLTVMLIVFVYSRYRIKVRLSKLLEDKNKETAKLNAELKDFNDRLEVKVKNRTTDLEDEIKERKKMDVELKKALKKTEDANYLKNAFLANMSHEIRTPLNGIIGFSSLLETELSLMENEELYEYANGIQQSGDRLMHLLNNVIDISKIEANDMDVDIKSCFVNEIVKNVSELYSFKVNDKGIKFNTKLNEIPKALADEPKLTKILSDIIDNALKYTEKGFINVLTDFNEDDEKVMIIVKDTGIGIDESYLDHIFEAFRQESLGYSRSYQGAGLGLPLAKRLVELMEGEIRVESTKGIGTTVSILIKAEVERIVIEEPVEKVIEKVTPEITKGDLRIFIVEDDRMNRLVLKKMLAKTGEVVATVDGEETMQVIEENHKKGIIFDIMLFDINLPAPWDGIKLMNAVKEKFKEYKTIPFIAQTAYAMTGDKERLLDSGFDNYIAKPINKNEMINMIKSQLSIGKIK